MYGSIYSGFTWHMVLVSQTEKYKNWITDVRPLRLPEPTENQYLINTGTLLGSV
jgi:hypothetical protein